MLFDVSCYCHFYCTSHYIVSHHDIWVKISVTFCSCRGSYGGNRNCAFYKEVFFFFSIYTILFHVNLHWKTSKCHAWLQVATQSFLCPEFPLLTTCENMFGSVATTSLFSPFNVATLNQLLSHVREQFVAKS